MRHHLATRIEDWVRAHHREPVDVNDMATAAGVGLQQLRVICRDEWGLTPLQYLRGVRLDSARELLRAAEERPGVIAAVAVEVGYRHLGRFAGDYRKRFGEYPRQTLARPPS
ncbi:helix-turn-helix domain-containing protein [Spirillospora sp. NPDC049652]